MRVLLVLATAIASVAPPARARLLTFDDAYHPDKKLDLADPPKPEWIDDRRFFWARPEGNDEFTPWVVEAVTGRAEPVFEAGRLEPALAAEGVEARAARAAGRRKAYSIGQAAGSVVVEAGNDLFHYDRGARRLRRLTRTASHEEEAALSPDGARVAFVRDHDLFVVEVASAQERRITSDGSPDILNGKLDWVYQEEVYGRGKFRAFWWSPDSRRLAFLRLDETKVPRYTLVDEIPYRAALTQYHYPKAGDPNPEVTLGVADAVAPRATIWLDLAAGSSSDPLVVDVAWTPDSQAVAFQVQDREQTWLDLNLGDPDTGRCRRLLRETTPAWVQPHGRAHWLRDGSFLWLSERSGWKHLYHHQPDGTRARAVTRGDWEVRAFHGINETEGWAYFSGTERSPRGLDVYRVRLDGSALTRLSARPGTHEARFAPSLGLWADTWSRVWSPPQVWLHRADGAELRQIDPGPGPALRDVRLAPPEFVQAPARDGFLMEALLFKPLDFDPARKYPVYQYTYGGPQAPKALDKWNPEHLFHQLLVQRGVVVWICDNRTASGKGAVSAWPAYQRLGEQELLDVEDGLAWLRKQPWVDGGRIGLHGHSYGGFMTSYALTHSTSFALGIAGSSVTDWRDYDSIYTERYMRKPENNADGYRRTAPRLAAARLHGALLLYHGLMDDNVHPQNTTQLADELQRANVPFRLMTYARSTHRIDDAHLARHLRAMMLAFVEETLQSPGRE